MIAVFDIGGTSIKYGILQAHEDMPIFLMQEEIDTNAKQLGGPGIEKKVISLIKEMKASYPISGIAISTAGMVDAEKGCITYANENIPNYTGLSFKRDLEAIFAIPCWVENDVNAAALGEFYYGAGRQSESLLMFTIGTGIGGAFIQQGKIYHGYSGSAGEIGYMWVNDQPFETLASTTALIHQVEQQTKETKLNGRIIFERAKDGDEICQKAIENLCENITKGISNCVYLLNPQMVVLGGGIMNQSIYLEPIMKKYIKQYVNKAILSHTQMAFASLGNHAGMMGAYAYFIRKEGEQHA